MSTVLERLPEGARVAVIRLRSLGDCVLTTPALHILKSARPDLAVGIVVEDAFAAVFEGNPDVERILTDGAGELARWHPDLILNLHGGTRSALLTIASRARLRAGFAHFRFRAIYNIMIPRAQEILGVERKVHTAEHIASAVFHLGAARRNIPRARLFASKNFASINMERRAPYAVLHPVASAPEKTWPAENFLAVAAHLRREAGLAPVFIAGPGESLEEFAEYECISAAPLSAIKTLLAEAAMFIGNDSGPAHMAAAFGIPAGCSVRIFRPRDLGALEDGSRRFEGRQYPRHWRRCRARSPGGLAGMRELLRLLRFVRPYAPQLLGSVLLMACVGASQGLMALLVGPIFDRVLNPSSVDAPVALVKIPVLNYTIYLNQLVPSSIHNVWVMVAVGILGAFFVKGFATTSGIT